MDTYLILTLDLRKDGLCICLVADLWFAFHVSRVKTSLSDHAWLIERLELHGSWIFFFLYIGESCVRGYLFTAADDDVQRNPLRGTTSGTISVYM